MKASVKVEQLELSIAGELPLTPPKWNEPIPLTDPTGQVRIYMCPQCEHVISNTSGGGWEKRRDFSHEEAQRHCCCLKCGVRIGSDDKSTFESRLYCRECRERQNRENELMQPLREAQAKKEAEAYEAALAKSKNRTAAIALHDLMSGISQSYYCAGWLIDLEFCLWPMLFTQERKFGMGFVSDDEVNRLRELSNQADGWWWGGPTDSSRIHFVTSDEWQAILFKRNEGK